MAGIGEASAIITIAQLGIKVSKTIFEYAGEVKEAPKEIRRIGRDICTTSERLEEIGRLINKNPTSHLFSEGGIASAVRCSGDCNEIIIQVTGLLSKGGWVSGPDALEKKDLDISLLGSLRWPFVRVKLASPQADLERVKASLSLLFNSAMANASSNPMQSEYALQIPKLKKWAEQATRKAENEKRKSRYTTASSGRPVQREVHWEDEQGGEDEEDAEMRQRFVEYRVSLIKEEEERRAQERAAYIQAEKEAKQKAEEVARRAIEQKAIDDYKKEQDDVNAQKSEREGKFKEELAQLGLEPEKIQTIIGTTGFQALEWDSVKQSQSRSRLLQASKSEQDSTKEINEASSVADLKMLNGGTQPTRPWFPRRFSKSQKPGPPYTEVDMGNGRNLEADHGPPSTQSIELWLVDLVSGHRMELAPSREWLRSKLDKARYDEISHKMAKLKHPWRTAISDFLRTRNEKEPPHLMWKLCFIGLPRRVSKLALFGHRRGDCLVRLVVCQQKLAEDVANNGPQLASSRLHAPDNSASIDSQTEPSSKASTRSHKHIFKSALRHATGPEGKTNGQNQTPESQEVSFADGGGSETQEDEVCTIKIETEVIGDEAPRGTTTIPSDLIPTSAFEELGLPWVPLPRGLDGDTRPLNKIPKALTRSEIDELERITKGKIIEGEVPWRKPPILRLEEREIVYVKSGQLQDRNSEPQRQPAAAGSARDNGRQDSKPEPNPANTSRVPRFEPADDQSGRSRHSERTEEIIVPRDNMNRAIESEYDVDSNGLLVPRAPRSYRRETEYLHPRSAAYDGRNNNTYTYSIPPPQPRRSSSYYDEYDRVPRREESWNEGSVREGRREIIEPPPPLPPPPVREEITHRHIDHGFERERPRYRDEREEVIDIRERRSRERPRDREEIILRERERDRPSYKEDDRVVERAVARETRPFEREDIIIQRERSPEERQYYRERDRSERDEEPIIIERDRPRGRDQDFDPVVIRRDSSLERPRYREERRYSFGPRLEVKEVRPSDRGEFIFRRYDRERDRYSNGPRRRERYDDRIYRYYDDEVTARERAVEEPRYIEEDEITIRRDRSQDRSRHREVERDERSEYGPLVLGENRSRPASIVINNSEPSWKGHFSTRPKTPGPPSRSATQRFFNDTDTYAESTAWPSYRESKHTFDTEPTDEEVISSALKRFTTFNDETEKNTMTSPAGIGSPGFSLRAEPPPLTLQEAERKLDALIEKQVRATKEGNLTTASDLQFYAIPDVRAQVEELRAQDVKAKEVRSGDLAAQAVRAYEEDKEDRARARRRAEAEVREESEKGAEEGAGQVSAGKSKVQPEDDDEENDLASSLMPSDSASVQAERQQGRIVFIEDEDEETDEEKEQIRTGQTIEPQEASNEDGILESLDEEEGKGEGEAEGKKDGPVKARVERWAEDIDALHYWKPNGKANGNGKVGGGGNAKRGVRRVNIATVEDDKGSEDDIYKKGR